MKKAKLDPLKDIFVVPLKGDKYMVYAPKSGLIFSTNKASLPKLAKYYKSLTGQKKRTKKKKAKKSKRKIQPADLIGRRGVALCLTTDCNLRCLYCYASGGERKKYMDWKIAKAAIDHAISRNKKVKRFGLGFHGGGEPFVAFDLMKKSVDYAKKQCKKNKLKFSTYSSTNGVLSEEQLNWAIKNKMQLILSFDGTPDIQNKQRPLTNGRKSYPAVKKTIDTLVKKKVPFLVRSTITKGSAKKMKDIVKHFHKLGIKRMHFEPAFECGRCLKTSISAPDPMVFMNEYIKAFELAEKYGMELYYSGGAINKITNIFCGAAGKNFFVTTDGYITSCPEVQHKDNSASKVFFYGKYNDRTGKFRIFKNRLKLLASRTVDKMDDCQSCFCKWHCAGDCLVKGWRETGSLFKVRTTRCTTNRELVKYTLLRYLSGKRIKMREFTPPKNVKVV